MKEITYKLNDTVMSASVFLTLVNKVWPGEYDENRTREALKKTSNITAWDGDELVACVRLLSDGYFFSTITEILVDPVYQKQGIGAKLMELVYDIAPNTLAFGVQAGNEAFFEQLGYNKGLVSYYKKKDRNH